MSREQGHTPLEPLPPSAGQRGRDQRPQDQWAEAGLLAGAAQRSGWVHSERLRPLWGPGSWGAWAGAQGQEAAEYLAEEGKGQQAAGTQQRLEQQQRHPQRTKEGGPAGPGGTRDENAGWVPGSSGRGCAQTHQGAHRFGRIRAISLIHMFPRGNPRLRAHLECEFGRGKQA